ncbi:Rrf2 family transcriptional regulator [Kosmotoga arenicorallina S304]|uniref:Rrf2 family transcriptional regulator n=1 Tax=Kosmotoga arenicorallina S304 TaxID=1453497 RepID=A0A176K438_9BACT|nr:Rrf2 family transcriptional regulator [Kosmotoga arenicorallina]OAA31772.1 Rrf2 family transcriptional regulator [Kosmotoga arenicorallina S304]
MGFTIKSSYALRALQDLAIASESGRELVSLSEIANKNKIPRDFLEKIFAELREAGFVKSTRGRYGGYTLAKKPEEIKLKAVILKLDRPMNSYMCLQSSDECEIDSNCAVKYVWLKLYKAMMDELGNMTLKDVVDLSKKIEAGQQIEISQSISKG